MDTHQHSHIFHLLKNFHIVRLKISFYQLLNLHLKKKKLAQHSPISKSNNQPQLGVISKNIRQFKTFLTRSYYYFSPTVR